MKHRTCTVLLLLVFPIFLLAQNHRIDSLTKALAIAVDKRIQADVLHQLASETWDYDFEKGLKYANQSFQISENISYKKGIARALTDLGLYHYFIGDYKNAEIYFRKAIRTTDQNYGDFPSYTYAHLGNLFRANSNFDSAQWYYGKSIELAQSPLSREALSFALDNAGNLYYNFSTYDQAMNYWQRALSLRLKSPDQKALAESWKSLGMGYKGFLKMDSARYYLDKIYGIALRENNPELKTFYFLNKGEIFFHEGDVLHAVTAYVNALGLLEKHDYRSYRALVLKRIGEVYASQGYYQRAVEYFLNSLRINEQLQNKQEEGWILGMIGRLYEEQGLAPLAKQYAQRSLSLLNDMHDEAGIAFAHTVIGFIHFKKGDLKTAMDHYTIALKIRNEMGDQNAIAEVVYNIARLHEAQGMYHKAMLYQKVVLKDYEKGGDKLKQVMVLNTLSLLAIQSGQWAEAMAYLKRSDNLAQAISNPILIRDTYKTYAAFYKFKGDYAKAIHYYDLYESLNDTIFSNQSATRIAELSALYQLEKKETEIEELHTENTQKHDVIRLQQSRIEQQNMVLVFSVLCVGLLLTVAIVLYRYYRTKSKAHKQLRRFNRDISEKNEEIQAQSEELTEANKTLIEMNHELIETKEEMEAQSEELREANETIHEINKGLENTINKRTSQLKEAYKELDTFFYRSSHDFRRPLTTFMGLAEVAKITVKDQNALELFSKVSETANNLDKMLIKLQSISDVGAQQLVYKEVLFKEIFENICDAFRDELQRKNIRTTCDIKLRDSFSSYPAMIKIIIENLVENSINFSGVSDPYIHFSVKQTDGYVSIEVNDNGQGIPEEFHKRVFEMYFRGNERSKGNGLGLYIVEKAIEKLDGIIRIESGQNKGTTFFIDLPLTR